MDGNKLLGLVTEVLASQVTNLYSLKITNSDDSVYAEFSIPLTDGSLRKVVVDMIFTLE